jgi:hypothetical protein
VSAPILSSSPIAELARWTFQGQAADGPTVQWLLNELDEAGMPCSWRTTKRAAAIHPAVQWEGDLIPSSDTSASRTNMLHVMAYGPLDGQGFGLMLRTLGMQDRRISRILENLADRITQRFAGNCLVGTTIIPGHEWENWIAQDGRTKLG